MNRNLIKQIRNEWRENLWLGIELLIVSVAVWALCLTLFVTLRPTFEEKGYDITDVYRIQFNTISSSSPEYVKPEDDNHKADKAAGIRSLISRIRKSPYVELAALSDNALPYQYNYAGSNMTFKDLPDTIKLYGNRRFGSPEMARILRLRSNKYTPEQLEEILKNNEVLISDTRKGYFVTSEKLKITDPNSFVGRYGHFNEEESYRRVGAVIAPMKRTEYEYKGSDFFVPILESDDDNIFASEIAVLVKPGMGKKFEDEFLTSPEMRRHGNYYLTELTPMQKIRQSSQRTQDSGVRLVILGVVFLLVIIFLGLLGTFWFRIRQRTGEIALRKTCGATSADIFRRIISEGLLLLLFASIPALIADGLLVYFPMRNYSFSMTDYQFSWIPATIAYFIALALMTVMIIIGIWFPARQAMKIEPAIALKDE